MYAKIINNKIVYSSENMELEINGVVCGVCNPLESDLLSNGYKPIRVEQVEVKEKDFEELEKEIVVYMITPQIFTPSVYDSFNSASAKNRLFLMFSSQINKFNQFNAAITEFLNNHTEIAFKCMYLYISKSIEQCLLTQEDYDEMVVSSKVNSARRALRR